MNKKYNGIPADNIGLILPNSGFPTRNATCWGLLHVIWTKFRIADRDGGFRTNKQLND